MMPPLRRHSPSVRVVVNINASLPDSLEVQCGCLFVAELLGCVSASPHRKTKFDSLCKLYGGFHYLRGKHCILNRITALHSNGTVRLLTWHQLPIFIDLYCYIVNAFNKRQQSIHS